MSKYMTIEKEFNIATSSTYEDLMLMEGEREVCGCGSTLPPVYCAKKGHPTITDLDGDDIPE